jgi:hypothetical protein
LAVVDDLHRTKKRKTLQVNERLQPVTTVWVGSVPDHEGNTTVCALGSPPVTEFGLFPAFRKNDLTAPAMTIE